MVFNNSNFVIHSLNVKDGLDECSCLEHESGFGLALSHFLLLFTAIPPILDVSFFPRQLRGPMSVVFVSLGLVENMV